MLRLQPPKQYSTPERKKRIRLRLLVILVGVGCLWSLHYPQMQSFQTPDAKELVQRHHMVMNANAGLITPTSLHTITSLPPGTTQEADTKPGRSDLFDGVLDQDLFKSELSQNELSDADRQKATELASSLATKISATEWLGPMAPIAISPFFGFTCLCGLSQFGESIPFLSSMLGDNNFITTNPVLNNPAVFWIFLTLTILTSLPKLTKVSKPVAQAVDQLEAYSAIVTLVVIRLAANMDMGETAGTDVAAISGVAAAGPAVMQMGFLSFTADTFLTIAAIINLIVINTVKFFFEVMVWLTPFPFVDAVWEGCSKALCAGLIAIYAWSPIVATVINLLLFVASAFAFRWIHRRVVYMRSILGDPIWARCSKAFGIPTKKELIVFPKTPLGPFPVKSKLRMTSTEEGWLFQQHRFMMPTKSHLIPKSNAQVEIQRGLLINRVEITGDEIATLLFSRRYEDLETVSEGLEVALAEQEPQGWLPDLA